MRQFLTQHLSLALLLSATSISAPVIADDGAPDCDFYARTHMFTFSMSARTRQSPDDVRSGGHRYVIKTAAEYHRLRDLIDNGHWFPWHKDKNPKEGDFRLVMDVCEKGRMSTYSSAGWFLTDHDALYSRKLDFELVKAVYRWTGLYPDELKTDQDYIDFFSEMLEFYQSDDPLYHTRDQ